MEKTKDRIYADCAAQHPPRQVAIEEAMCAIRNFGNPSGVHSAASDAAAMLFEARRKTAAALGAKPSEVVFTSSGTEADNLAIYNGSMQGMRQGRNRLLVFVGEHKAVINAAKMTERIGMTVDYVPSTPDGVADIMKLEHMLDDKVAMVSLMYANNETGVIQPVKQAAQLAHKCGALFHTDAVQAVGHIPVSVKDIECDMLSLSAHKFGGIVGAGALYVRDNLPIVPQMAGGMQERGRRAGTEALPAIYAMGAAIEAAYADMEREAAHTEKLCSVLKERLKHIDNICFPGENAERLPGVLCLLLPGKDGERIALLLDREGICASSGAACTTGDAAASHVLTAMGYDERAAKGALRFSFCAENSFADAERIAEVLLRIIDE
ncbi:MAG: cysteine desulfurase [Ruminococcaceae bacterium]|nr:cysteine desulfurase [Oscillospiraceae bacterium]